MMLIIPITFLVDGKPVSNVFQSIIAAEGIAPFAAKTFLGMGGRRAAPPRITGGHPLNPFADRVLVYSAIPRFASSKKFAEVWHGTAFVVADEPDVEICGLSETFQSVPEGFPAIRQVCGAIFFKRPEKLRFVFADETNHDWRMGLRASPNAKHEESFTYQVLDEWAEDARMIVDVNDGAIEKICQLPAASFSAGAVREAFYESEFEERFQGAELGYALGLFQGENDPSVKFAKQRSVWQNLVLGVRDLFASRMHEANEAIVEIGRRFSASWRGPEPPRQFVFTRGSGRIGERHQTLLRRFCDLLCAHPFVEWNWSDNAMRAEFTRKVLNDCIIPALKGTDKNDDDAKIDKWINSITKGMETIERKFNEPYTFLLEEEKLESPFVIAFWRVMNSEGRHDRIKEAATVYAGKEHAYLTLALYGAMCGYAGFCMKRLVAIEERPGPTMREWIDAEVEKYDMTKNGSVRITPQKAGTGNEARKTRVSRKQAEEGKQKGRKSVKKMEGAKKRGRRTESSGQMSLSLG